MLFGNAYAFPGLTLVADDHPLEQMLKMSEKLQEQFPRASDIEADIKKQEESAVKERLQREKKFKEDDEQQDEAPQMKLKFSPDLVIQSEQFLKRWCPKRPENLGLQRWRDRDSSFGDVGIRSDLLKAHTIPRVLPTVNEFLSIKKLPVDERWQMLALAGAGSFDPKLDSDIGPFEGFQHDPSNPVYTQWVHESMTQNKLACVTAGKDRPFWRNRSALGLGRCRSKHPQEFTWGANVPASTVVVTKSFAETTSVAGMLQYVGRAARRGLTTHGQAIFERDEDQDLQRIFASPDGLSTEALTMERYAEWWLSRGKVW
eukprot:s1583_g5.t1